MDRNLTLQQKIRIINLFSCYNINDEECVDRFFNLYQEVLRFTGQSSIDYPIEDYIHYLEVDKKTNPDDWE